MVRSVAFVSLLGSVLVSAPGLAAEGAEKKREGTMSALSGDGQVVPAIIKASGVREATFAPLRAKLADRQRLLAGKPVRWSVASAAATGCKFGTEASVDSVTEPDGTVTMGGTGKELACSPARDGVVLVKAAFGSIAFTFRLNVGGASPPADVITAVTGTAQTVPRSGDSAPGGKARFEPIVLNVKNAAGQVVPNKRVLLQCSDTGVRCAASLNSWYTTDASGTITVPATEAYYGSGVQTVIARGDNTNAATFLLTVPDIIEPNVLMSRYRDLGNGQVAWLVKRAQAERKPCFRCRFNSRYNGLREVTLEFVPVTWSVDRGGCTLGTSGTLRRPNTTFTNDDGITALPGMTCTSVGPVVVTATHGTSKLSFTATVRRP